MMLPARTWRCRPASCESSASLRARASFRARAHAPATRASVAVSACAFSSSLRPTCARQAYILTADQSDAGRA
eukprot:4610662-Pyramimonas_sp.AAC.1